MWIHWWMVIIRCIHKRAKWVLFNRFDARVTAFLLLNRPLRCCFIVSYGEMRYVYALIESFQLFLYKRFNAKSAPKFRRKRFRKYAEIFAEFSFPRCDCEYSWTIKMIAENSPNTGIRTMPETKRKYGSKLLSDTVPSWWREFNW